MLSQLPHHDGSPLYVSTQNPELGDQVTLRLRVPENYPRLRAVTVRSNPDNEPHWDDAEFIGTEQGWSWWQASVTVANPHLGYRWLLVFEEPAPVGVAPEILWLNQAGLHTGEVLDSDDFVLLTYPEPPGWLNNSVMYQIFPDRFSRSAAANSRQAPEWAQPAQWNDPVDPVMPSRVHQFYGGDLDGIVERLDHLQALGVGIIYLTPFFPAASNHRYDASSFASVDPLLGGDSALIRLVEASHERGIKVIGDLTTNHSGDRHEWFQRARADADSTERGYYFFASDELDAKYECWLGTKTLPKFNWASPELRLAFIEGPDSVVAKWLKPPYNLDGWRVDVGNITGRLRDQDFNAEVRQILRKTMLDVKPDSILLAEYANDPSSDFNGDAWHGAMTYPSFTRPLWRWLSAPDGGPYLNGQGEEERAPWYFGQPLGGIPQSTAQDFSEAVTRFNSQIPWRVRLGNMQALDSHDTARFATNAAPGTLPLAVGLQMTLPGLPTLFAGDEFGLTGADGELSRTPLPWGSVDEPQYAQWLRMYHQLSGLRTDYPALHSGGMRWLHADETTLVFVRETAEESLLVLAANLKEDGTVITELPASSVSEAANAIKLWGESVLSTEVDSLRFTVTGPTFSVWKLPGVATPDQP